MDKLTEVWNNGTAPINPTTTSGGGGTLVAGNVQIIAVEVAVSKLIRWIMKVENKSVFHLIAVHTVSQAFLGGFGGFFGDVKYFSSKPELTQAVKDGAKGIPGLFAAQYVVNVANNGLHFPKMSFKDMLITGASKAITRPLINLAYGSLGTTMQRNFVAHDEMLNKQAKVARFGSAESGQ